MFGFQVINSLDCQRSYYKYTWKKNKEKRNQGATWKPSISHRSRSPIKITTDYMGHRAIMM